MSLQEFANAAFDYQTNNLYTAMPGIIVTVRDNFNQLSVDVQPSINIKNKDGTTKERPVVLNVPVQMPSSSTAALTFPVNIGDPVLLVYSMRSVDNWKRGQGRPSVPNDNRKFDKRDCIAIPGIWPFGQSINNPSVRVWTHSTGDLVISNNIGGTENEVRLHQGGNITINTNQNVEVNCTSATITAQADVDVICQNFTVDAAGSFDVTAATGSITIPTTNWIGTINHTGTYVMTGGSATFNGITFNTHKHTGVTTGVGTSGNPTN